jgi:uroporphyrinogen-III synthase
MRLLVTRPEPDNARTAAVLRAQGHEVALAPMLHIEAVPNADLGAPPWSGILITSANGARALASHPRRGELMALPVLAVGRSSAEAARAAGFADVSSADGDAGDLARLAAQRFPGARQPLLYLAGEDRSGELSVPGAVVRTVVIYRAVGAESFAPDAQTALKEGRIDAVLHFSRRSVDSYLDCGRDIGAAALRPIHYCLSARAAEPLKAAGAARVEVAVLPDEASLLALVTPKS